MKVQQRAIDARRHTIGYRVSGKWVTRKQAARLARAGRIPGVVARQRGGEEYIMASRDFPRLYDLPTRLPNTIRNRAFGR